MPNPDPVPERFGFSRCRGCTNTVTSFVLQRVPFPTCWLFRGEWKHLFIILCIISHSIILITSFPQDASEMDLSYHWRVSNVRNLLTSAFSLFFPGCHHPLFPFVLLAVTKPITAKKKDNYSEPSSWSPVIKGLRGFHIDGLLLECWSYQICVIDCNQGLDLMSFLGAGGKRQYNILLEMKVTTIPCPPPPTLRWLLLSPWCEW